MKIISFFDKDTKEVLAAVVITDEITEKIIDKLKVNLESRLETTLKEKMDYTIQTADNFFKTFMTLSKKIEYLKNGLSYDVSMEETKEETKEETIN